METVWRQYKNSLESPVCSSACFLTAMWKYLALYFLVKTSEVQVLFLCPIFGVSKYLALSLLSVISVIVLKENSVMGFVITTHINTHSKHFSLKSPYKCIFLGSKFFCTIIVIGNSEKSIFVSELTFSKYALLPPPPPPLGGE